MNQRSLIQSALLSQDEEVRLSGLQSLYSYNGEGRLDLVCSALGDSSWRIRKEATTLFLSFPEASASAERIVGLLYDEENAGLRNAAAEILVKLDGSAVPILISAADTPDHDVRKFVLDILGDIGDLRATPLLLRLLREDRETNVRAAAAENLGKIGDATAVTAMLVAISDPDLLVQFSLLEALGKIGAIVPVESLTPLYQNPLLRKPLFDALGRIGDESTLPLLLNGLNDPMRNVREAALLALQELVTRHGDSLLSARLSEKDLDGVKDQLKNGTLPVQRAALNLLGLRNDRESTLLLASYLDDPAFADQVATILSSKPAVNTAELLACWAEGTETKKAYLSYLFAVTGVTDAVPFLVRELKEADDFLRTVLLRSLGQICGEDEIVTLAGYLDVSDAEVRQAAVDGLIKAAGRFHLPVIDLVQKFYQHDEPEVRQAVLQILGRLGGNEADAVLLLAMKDVSPQVRCTAISCLDGRNFHHYPALTLALTDEESDVRRRAVDALAMGADNEMIEPLMLILDDEDPWVRESTVRALGRYGGSVALNAIRRGLRDPVGLVAIAALETLDRENLLLPNQELEQELEHNDDDVVLSLLQVLGKSSDTQWLDHWGERLLGHKSSLVRIKIVESLSRRGRPARELLQNHLAVEGDEEVRRLASQLLDAMTEPQ